MGTKVDQTTKEQEASRLLALMKDRWKSADAAFAREAGRSRAELQQHLTAARPIPLSAVKAYSKVLNCPVSDISQRWADELTTDSAEKKVLHLPGQRDALIDELVTIADRMTDRGKIELIGMAKALCASHNKPTSINAASSQ